MGKTIKGHAISLGLKGGAVALAFGAAFEAGRESTAPKVAPGEEISVKQLFGRELVYGSETPADVTIWRGALGIGQYAETEEEKTDIGAP